MLIEALAAITATAERPFREQTHEAASTAIYIL